MNAQALHNVNIHKIKERNKIKIKIDINRKLLKIVTKTMKAMKHCQIARLSLIKQFGLEKTQESPEYVRRIRKTIVFAYRTLCVAR